MKWIACCLIVYGFLAFNVEENQEVIELKKELGHRLFYDTRLSANGTKSCASCHDPKLGYTDGYRKSTGLYGDETRFNSPSVLNMDGFRTVTWADSNLHSLNLFLDRPMFGTSPKELGLSKKDTAVLKTLSGDSIYTKILADLGESEFYWSLINESITHYIANLYSRNSRFDAYLSGKMKFSNDEKAGYRLYKKNCENCHSGKDLNVPVNTKSHYNAILSETESGGGELLRVRTPSLRNVSITGPYMHDGRYNELSDCLSHSGNVFSGDEKYRIISFLHTLTDTSYLKNKFYLDPFSTQ